MHEPPPLQKTVPCKLQKQAYSLHSQARINSCNHDIFLEFADFIVLKAALMEDLSAAKKAVVDREIFCLLERGLAANLMSFVAELLGPEGLRRASPLAAATGAAATAHQVKL